MEKNDGEGWIQLWNARKFHYFRSGISLCGKWMLLGRGSSLQKGDFVSPQDCAACGRKLLAENKKKSRKTPK